ncbi:hypothetical protein D0T53_11370 [Dysgonomonas sp. 216]|uniref:hypothetical protein n=1 Tax=Dysgonomonas sp. 216 TaxID=2302934 RepID=UPI0013CF80F8|nr:hypothetical protein [Dysgonomonas sp. 216]NDW19505.1 hypothetical protein [Dysgonomonas sp. 216]
MGRLKFLFILWVFPLFCYSQFLGFAGQYTPDSDGQFVTNLSFPAYHKKNKLNAYISSGLEYSTPGGAKMSGLNIKPVQFTTFFGERFFSTSKVTLLLSVDGGYLFDFRRRSKDGILITPNLYADYKFFFVKAGYDFDVINGRNQFFVRAGISLGMGIFKSFAKTQIW